MQRLPIRLLVALITFCVGVVITGVWIARQIPQIDPAPLLEAPRPKLQSRCFPGRSQKIDQLSRAESGYFPEGVFFSDARLSESFVRGYAIRLKQLNEPTLLKGAHTAYRFLWLRSFHSRVAVRVWIDGEKKMLSVKELSRDADGESATLLVNHTRTMTPDEWVTFTRLLDESCFWEMPATYDPMIAHDGAWWVFEGAYESHYHVTHQQSPQSGLYHELGLYMLKLSDLPLDESKGEIY